MKLVQQLNDFDCGPACIAMVASISYKDAVAITKRNGKGTIWKELLQTLKKLKIKTKKIKGEKDLEKCKTAIVAVSWETNTRTWHFVVFHDNRIYDPLLKKPVTLQELKKTFPIIRSYAKIL